MNLDNYLEENHKEAIIGIRMAETATLLFNYHLKKGDLHKAFTYLTDAKKIFESLKELEMSNVPDQNHFQIGQMKASQQMNEALERRMHVNRC